MWPPHVRTAIPPDHPARGLRLLDKQEFAPNGRYVRASPAGLSAPDQKPPKIVTAVAERCARANDMDAGVRGINDCNAPLAGSLLRDLDCHVEEGIAVKLSSDEVGVETEE